MGKQHIEGSCLFQPIRRWFGLGGFCGNVPNRNISSARRYGTLSGLFGSCELLTEPPSGLKELARLQGCDQVLVVMLSSPTLERCRGFCCFRLMGASSTSRRRRLGSGTLSATVSGGLSAGLGRSYPNCAIMSRSAAPLSSN